MNQPARKEPSRRPRRQSARGARRVASGWRRHRAPTPPRRLHPPSTGGRTSTHLQLEQLPRPSGTALGGGGARRGAGHNGRSGCAARHAARAPRRSCRRWRAAASARSCHHRARRRVGRRGSRSRADRVDVRAALARPSGASIDPPELLRREQREAAGAPAPPLSRRRRRRASARRSALSTTMGTGAGAAASALEAGGATEHRRLELEDAHAIRACRRATRGPRPAAGGAGRSRRPRSAESRRQLGLLAPTTPLPPRTAPAETADADVARRPRGGALGSDAPRSRERREPARRGGARDPAGLRPSSRTRGACCGEGLGRARLHLLAHPGLADGPVAARRARELDTSTRPPTRRTRPAASGGAPRSASWAAPRPRPRRAGRRGRAARRARLRRRACSPTWPRWPRRASGRHRRCVAAGDQAFFGRLEEVSEAMRALVAHSERAADSSGTSSTWR